MEDFYVSPNILYLTGITMDDYKSIEDIFEEYLHESIEKKPDITNIVYNTIPKVFTGIQNWIKKTNLKCWNCDFTFESVPKFVPIYIKENYTEISDIEIGVHGNFCSFACVSNYINTNYHKRHEILQLLDNLCELYRYYTGRTAYFIPLAPSKTILIQYGGNTLDIEYKEQIRKIEDAIEEKLIKQ